jgi:biotin carboxyl carrier protein
VKYVATVDGRDFVIDVERAGEVEVDGEPVAVDLEPIDGTHLFSLVVDHASHELFIERREGTYYILIEGDRYAADVEQERLKRLREMSGAQRDESGTRHIAAPMPGMVVKVLVNAGDSVAEDQGLVILEAMKMENEIRTARAGVVTSVNVQAGSKVNLGDILATVEER